MIGWWTLLIAVSWNTEKVFYYCTGLSFKEDLILRYTHRRVQDWSRDCIQPTRYSTRGLLKATVAKNFLFILSVYSTGFLPHPWKNSTKSVAIFFYIINLQSFLGLRGDMLNYACCVFASAIMWGYATLSALLPPFSELCGELLFWEASILTLYRWLLIGHLDPTGSVNQPFSFYPSVMKTGLKCSKLINQ